jgi:alpha-D-ribose 1-methylphosphonate 5-triphosphate synthase subunit PhnG
MGVGVTAGTRATLGLGKMAGRSYDHSWMSACTDDLLQINEKLLCHGVDL